MSVKIINACDVEVLAAERERGPFIAQHRDPGALKGVADLLSACPVIMVS